MNLLSIHDRFWSIKYFIRYKLMKFLWYFFTKITLEYNFVSYQFKSLSCLKLNIIFTLCYWTRHIKRGNRGYSLYFRSNPGTYFLNKFDTFATIFYMDILQMNICLRDKSNCECTKERVIHLCLGTYTIFSPIKCEISVQIWNVDKTNPQKF